MSLNCSHKAFTIFVACTWTVHKEHLFISCSKCTNTNCSHRAQLESTTTHCLIAVHILHEESVRIVPGQEHILKDPLYPLLLKLQTFSLHCGGVTQIQPGQLTFVKLKCWRTRKLKYITCISVKLHWSN